MQTFNAYPLAPNSNTVEEPDYSSHALLANPCVPVRKSLCGRADHCLIRRAKGHPIKRKGRQKKLVDFR
jgi:hypothetical protein